MIHKIAPILLLIASPMMAASPPPATGEGGAVAAAEPLAVEVGLDILRQGGNAADAAVATALALAVVHPEAGNLGGGGFAILRMEGAISSLDFREKAPAAAHRDLYLDDGGQPIENASLLGPLASGVPGTPQGLFELHRRYGDLPWPQVVLPAQQLAEKGFRVTRRLNQSLTSSHDLLVYFPETKDFWFPDDTPLPVGFLLRQPALAQTLKRLGLEGPEALSHGPLAKALVARSRQHGGILSLDDLQTYQAIWREPVIFSAFDWKVASMGLPSSGGIILASSLPMIESFRWANLPAYGANRAHLLAEIWRRAYADRFLLGDPSSTLATEKDLLDPAYLSRKSAVDLRRATDSQSIQPWPGSPPPESNETSHLAVADAKGNIVSLTTTLNGAFGCKLWIPELGYFLNNEMDDFSTVPGRPNLYGLIQGPANEVAAGRRMLSSQSPTIAWNGERAIALGGRGGSKIPTAVMQVLLGVVVDDLDLQEAINQPRIHHQWLPDRISYEPGSLSPETQSDLEKRGHPLQLEDSLGKVNAVEIEGKVFYAAGDPRGPSAAGVVRSPRP